MIIGKAPSLTDSKTTIQTSGSSCFLCSRDQVCLALFCKFWLRWKYILSVNLDTRPWWQICIFIPWALKWCGISTAWNSIQLLFSYFWKNCFAPPFGISEVISWLATPHLDPIRSLMSPRWGDDCMPPSSLRHIPAAWIVMGSTGMNKECVWKGRKWRETHDPDSGF